MNPSLTVNTLTFTQQYSDKTGSARREVSRGVNLPENMYIKHQSFTDSLKREGTQSALIFEYVKPLADGTLAVVASATLKVRTLADTAVTATEITNVIARIVDVVGAGSGQLNLGTNIFVNKEQ